MVHNHLLEGLESIFVEDEPIIWIKKESKDITDRFSWSKPFWTVGSSHSNRNCIDLISRNSLVKTDRNFESEPLQKLRKNSMDCPSCTKPQRLTYPVCVIVNIAGDVITTFIADITTNAISIWLDSLQCSPAGGLSLIFNPLFFISGRRISISRGAADLRSGGAATISTEEPRALSSSGTIGPNSDQSKSERWLDPKQLNGDRVNSANKLQSLTIVDLVGKDLIWNSPGDPSSYLWSSSPPMQQWPTTNSGKINFYLVRSIQYAFGRKIQNC